MPTIKYSGPFAESSGYAQANRNIIKALHESGIKVSTELQVYAHHPTDYGEQFELANSLQNKYEDYRVKVLHITPNVYAKHKEEGKYHVGHLFWETTGMSPDWQKYLQDVDEIWTGCKWNEECFRNAGFSKPIKIFPQPVNLNVIKDKMPIDGVKDGDFVFYSIFQWIERKDPRSLLTAYWREFEGHSDTVLVIKTYGLGFSEHQRNTIYRDIKKWKSEVAIRSFPRVLIIDYLLSDKEIHMFHESGDCFVSAHRGEGWAIPQCEAIAHEKPVISTGLGGVHEWIDNIYKVNYEMCNVSGMDWAEQYRSDQLWGQVDINDLRQKMRHVYQNRDEAKSRAKKARKEAEKKLSFDMVGEVMKKRIIEIEKELT